MTDLLDGRHVPWHFVSGKTETGATGLPPPVRRDLPALPNPVHVRPAHVPRMAEALKTVDTAARFLTEQMRRFK